MSNFDTVVLDGEMGLFTKVREGDLPYYTGATEVTPSDSTQILETADTIVTENITINPIPDIDLEEVQVTYTPDEEGQTDTITPSTGYAGISEVEVTVEPIDPDYVGSNIARNDSDDLTASGATVTAPAGYYEEAATKSVASGSAATPATEIIANPTISVGNDGSITASVSATQSVTPSVTAGYVSTGTAGTITVSGSGSAQLSTQPAATITPSTSQQTAVAAGKFTTGNVVVDAMPSGTAGTPTATKGTVSNHSVSVTPSVTNQTGYITGGTKTGTAVTVSASELVSGSQTITQNGPVDVTNLASVTVAVPGDTPTLETKAVSYTPTESVQTDTVTPSTGYDGLDQVNVTVGAIDSEYVGSDVPRRSSSDLSASGDTVTAPAGYYASAVSKSVASGTAGTPSATKGTVSNHSVSVTPSVTNTAGYISGGTISGTAVSVSASELVSGTFSITDNGTGIDVTDYAAVDVNVSGGGGTSDDDWMNKTVTSITTNQTDFKLILDGFSELVTFSAPNLLNLFNANYFFRNCAKLTSVSMPSLQRMYGVSMFENTKITTLVLPNFTHTSQTIFGGNNFKNCSNFEALDCASINRIDNSAFANAPVFETLIIRGLTGGGYNELPNLTNTGAFDNTPFASGGTGGTLYVPEAYIADYQSATNWSSILGYANNQIKKIEGSYYETHYADGTTIPTT